MDPTQPSRTSDLAPAAAPVVDDDLLKDDLVDPSAPVTSLVDVDDGPAAADALAVSDTSSDSALSVFCV